MQREAILYGQLEALIKEQVVTLIDLDEHKN